LVLVEALIGGSPVLSAPGGSVRGANLDNLICIRSSDSEAQGYFARIAAQASDGPCRWIRVRVSAYAGAAVAVSLVAIGGCGGASQDHGSASSGPASSSPLQVGSADRLAKAVARVLAGAPNSAETYQDCSAIGPTESATDPLGDVRDNFHERRVTGHPRIDLMTVEVAASHQALCVDMTLAGPPITTDIAKPANGGSYSFSMASVPAVGSYGAGGHVKLAVQLSSDGRRLVRLIYPGADESLARGFVRAAVGVSATKLSIMIARSRLPSFVPFNAFQWSATALARGGPGIELFDCVPDGARDPIYPPGTSSATGSIGCGL
jgi:hypothetical protein